MKKYMITLVLLCLRLPILSAQEDWLDCMDNENIPNCPAVSIRPKNAR